jgi:hypothetical protein
LQSIIILDDECIQTNANRPEWICAGRKGAGVGSIITTVLGKRIGTYVDENGLNTDIFESVSSLVENAYASFLYLYKGGLTY